MTAGLDDPVLRPLHCLQLRGQTVDALVVGAVDAETLPIEYRRKRDRQSAGFVSIVPRLRWHMLFRAGQMLRKAAAEKHIQYLMAAADAQNGFPRPEICLYESEFRLVTRGVNAEAGVVLLTVAGRVHIAAAGEDEGVIFLRLRFRQIGCCRDAAKGFHRRRIVLHQLRPQGNLYLRLHSQLPEQLPFSTRSQPRLLSPLPLFPLLC